MFSLSFSVAADVPEKPQFAVQLPKSLEPQRREIELAFARADMRLRQFSKVYGWDKYADKPFIQVAKVFASKPDFDKRLREIGDVGAEVQLPVTYSAALEKEEFIAVSPEVYLKNYPDGKEADYYEKLITHEMAHRLHVRILQGREQKMGPVWFYEGFAIFAADQFVGREPKLSEEEIWRIVADKDRGSYIKYASVIRFFLKKATLQQLVIRAGDSDFITWLKGLN
jgi:hypothetical protein